MTNIEIWKPIKDYEGFYEISNLGRVKIIPRFIINSQNGIGGYWITERIMKQSSNSGMYYKINLSKNGSYKTFNCHRLVAENFIPNPNNYPQVNHKDENTHNNYVDNLEWCTAKYNTNYGKGNEKRSRSKCKKVLQYDFKMNFIKEWDSGVQTTLYGYDNNLISRCCRYNQKSHKGYIWRFKEDLKFE